MKYLKLVGCNRFSSTVLGDAVMERNEVRSIEDDSKAAALMDLFFTDILNNEHPLFADVTVETLHHQATEAEMAEQNAPETKPATRSRARAKAQ